MKTNQVMKRPLANFVVEQRTKDGMFCATSLLKQWNEVGEAYKELASAVCKIVNRENVKFYMERIAKGLNFIIVGGHEHLARNEYGTEEKQKEISTKILLKQ